MNVELPYDHRRAAGCWSIDVIDLDVRVSCPACTKECHLSEHGVQKDGTVFPDFACPWHPCAFSRTLVLLDWPGWTIESKVSQEPKKKKKG